MKELKDLTMEEGIQADKDTLGGYSVQDSGLYHAMIQLAFITMAASKALALNVHMRLKETGAIVTQQFWFRSGETKGCKNYYEKDGEKHYLPGFNMANALCELVAGKPLKDMVSEEKIVKLYDYEQKGEVPTKVQMLTELVDKEVIVGLIKQIVDKQKKNDAGEYVPTGETRAENEVDKFFHGESGQTLTELKAFSAADFLEKWAGKWKGQTKDKSSGVAADSTVPGAAKPTAAKQPTGKAAPKQSLFS